MNVSGELHTHAASAPGKESQVHIELEAGWAPQSASKLFPFRNQTVIHQS